MLILFTTTVRINYKSRKCNWYTEIKFRLITLRKAWLHFYSQLGSKAIVVEKQSNRIDWLIDFKGVSICLGVIFCLEVRELCSL